MKPKTLSLITIFATTLTSLQNTSIADNDCGSLKKDFQWQPMSGGIHYMSITSPCNKIENATIFRYSTDEYKTSLFDMRDLPDLGYKHDYYAPPQYSLKELRLLMPAPSIISSAGLTKSLNLPLPAGFLKISGKVRSKIAPKDKIMKGVVCMGQNGTPSIINLDSEKNLESLENNKTCHSGFQTGPFVLIDGQHTATSSRMEISRIVYASNSNNDLLLAYISPSTINDVADLLLNPNIQARTAIALQSDYLGAINLAKEFHTKVGRILFGNNDTTVASALIIQKKKSKNAVPKK